MLALLAVALLSLPATAQRVNVTNLTSDITNAANNHDGNLVNPWGLSISPTSPWWVSDNGSGLSTLYDGNGVAQSLVVTIPTGSGSGTGTPSGTVYNGTSDFKIHGFATPFLFCTEDGTISGWYTGTNAFIAVNNSSSGAVYKGMALASAGGHNYIYVANFHAGTIEAYDGSYALHSFGSGAFTDSSIPAGYAPFNVQLIGTSQLVVTYAKQDAAKHDDVPGPGNGYVDIYDTSGNLLVQMQHNLFLNAPWGVVVAPQSFSGFSNDLLVGQFGSGAIMAYNPNTGVWIGNVLNVNTLTLQIDGLWALAFGNGSGGGSASTLYFTAGYFGEAHGVFGSMTPHTGP
ncbi:MAG: TIGR03118 family protein [Candidatus Korobacteraceae bacterium]